MAKKDKPQPKGEVRHVCQLCLGKVKTRGENSNYCFGCESYICDDCAIEWASLDDKHKPIDHCVPDWMKVVLKTLKDRGIL